jgi:hypothetical protein
LDNFAPCFTSDRLLSISTKIERIRLLRSPLFHSLKFGPGIL